MNNGFHHLHARKRSGSKLDPYPHPVFWKRVLDRIIYVGSIAPPLLLSPQAWEVIAKHNATGIVPLTWIGLGIMNILWVVYGIVHKEPPIVITNVLLMILNFVIATGAIMWG